jgi:hypothetical protein
MTKDAVLMFALSLLLASGAVNMRSRLMSNGKGSRPRPCDVDRYRANYDRIFGNKWQKKVNVKIGKAVKG